MLTGTLSAGRQRMAETAMYMQFTQRNMTGACIHGLICLRLRWRAV